MSVPRPALAQARARIAELEAERDRLTERETAWFKRDALWHKLNARNAELEAALNSVTVERGAAQAERDEILHNKHDRIAELEAEVSKLRFALEVIRAGETANPANMANDALSRGEAYAYRSENHGPSKKP